MQRDVLGMEMRLRLYPNLAAAVKPRQIRTQIRKQPALSDWRWLPDSLDGKPAIIVRRLVDHDVVTGVEVSAE